jgi:hypothetical protein
LAMLRRVVKRSERTRSENESASKQVFVRSREFGGAVRRKTNESCLRIEDLNESEERKAKSEICEAQSSHRHLQRHYQRRAVRAHLPC